MGHKCNCDAKTVEAWAEELLVKELKPGQIVVMDNASFHNKKKLREIIEKVGCRLGLFPGN
jgi:transposase